LDASTRTRKPEDAETGGIRSAAGMASIQKLDQENAKKLAFGPATRVRQ
jgi:hypothetical protein